MFVNMLHFSGSKTVSSAVYAYYNGAIMELPRIPAVYLYEYWKGNQDKCIYCGRDSSCQDHVLPKSLAEKLPFENWPREILLIVPCCQQCNNIAKARLFSSLEAKRNYIQGRLRARILADAFGASMCGQCFGFRIKEE